MPLFFFLSGYVFRPVSFRILARRKARQLLLPYGITCVLLILFSVLLLVAKGEYSRIPGRTAQLFFAALYVSGLDQTTPFFIPQIGAIWFLWALFWGLLLLNLLLRLRSPYPLLILLFLAGLYTASRFWLPLSLQPAMTGVFYLYFGISGTSGPLDFVPWDALPGSPGLVPFSGFFSPFRAEKSSWRESVSPALFESSGLRVRNLKLSVPLPFSAPANHPSRPFFPVDGNRNSADPVRPSAGTAALSLVPGPFFSDGSAVPWHLVHRPPSSPFAKSRSQPRPWRQNIPSGTGFPTEPAGAGSRILHLHTKRRTNP